MKRIMDEFNKVYFEIIGQIEFEHLKKNRNLIYPDKTHTQDLITKFRISLKIVRLFLAPFNLKKGSNKKILTSNSTVFFDLSRQHLTGKNGINQDFEEFLKKDFLKRIPAPNKNVFIINSKFTKFYPSLEFIKSYNDFLFLHSGRSKLIQIAKFLPFIMINIFIHKTFYKTILDILEIYIYLDSNQHGSNFYIVTNSSLSKMPSIFYVKKNFREFKTCIALYSENNFTQIGNKPWRDKLVPPNLFVDYVYVWTEEYKNYLCQYAQGSEIHNVGSIVFKLKTPGKRIGQQQIISIFDVIPDKLYTKDTVFELKYGLQFLFELEKFKKMLIFHRVNTTLVLKHARRVLKTHETQYLKQVQELKSREILGEIDWSDNIYDLIKSSKMVITSYGTSPALIAREYSRPVVYLCTDSNFENQNPVNYKIPILNNANQLFNFYMNC